MLEFVAIGPQGGQRWRRRLPADQTIRIGRAPTKGWAVPWDLRISREHCDIHLVDDRLYVRVLDVALNPAYRLGEPTKDFSIGPGEAFRIGQTTFRIDRIESRQTIADAPDPFDSRDFEVKSAPPWDAPAERPVEEDVDSLRAHLAELRAQLAAGSPPPQPQPPDDATQKKREELRRLREEIESLKAQAAAPPPPPPPPSPPPAPAPPAPAPPAAQPGPSEIEELKALIGDLQKELRRKGETPIAPPPAREETLPPDEPPPEKKPQPAPPRPAEIRRPMDVPAAKAEAPPAKAEPSEPKADAPPAHHREPAPPAKEVVKESAKEKEAPPAEPKREPPPKPKNPGLEALKARLEAQAAKKKQQKADSDEGKKKIGHGSWNK